MFTGEEALSILKPRSSRINQEEGTDKIEFQGRNFSEGAESGEIYGLRRYQEIQSNLKAPNSRGRVRLNPAYKTPRSRESLTDTQSVRFRANL